MKKSWFRLSPPVIKGGFVGCAVGTGLALLSFYRVINLWFVWILGGPFVSSYLYAAIFLPGDPVGVAIIVAGFLLNVLYLFLVGALITKLYLYFQNIFTSL